MIVDESETYIGLREAAERLDVHYMTVYRYVRIGQLPAERQGATWRIAVSDLERLRTPDPRPSRSRPSQAHRPTRLLDRLVAGDEPGAWQIVEEALASGTSAKQVYVEVLVPALRTIGERWASGELTIAAEHRASAIATRIVGRLGPMFARRGLSRGTIVLGAPEGDLHALPSAIVADLLRGRGFDVLDLGANTPVTSFVECARGANRLIAVLVGVTSKESVSHLSEIASALRREGVGAPLLVGGRAVPGESIALNYGADGWTGMDAEAVLAAIENLAPTSRSVSD
jgi:excisionase family DNA binding protein